MAPHLTSKLITLIPLQSIHEAEYIALSNEPTISARLNNPIPFTSAHFQNLLQLAQNERNHLWMIVKNDQICGSIQVLYLRPIGLYQISFSVLPAFRKIEIATTALKMVQDYLFEKTDAVRIQALIEPSNPASVHTIEKSGYAREGLLRSFYPSITRGVIDIYMYSVIKRESKHD